MRLLVKAGDDKRVAKAKRVHLREVLGAHNGDWPHTKREIDSLHTQKNSIFDNIDIIFRGARHNNNPARTDTSADAQDTVNGFRV